MTGEVQPGRGDEAAASPGELRASHEDRDRVAEVLRAAAGDGRLTAEELDLRLEKALTARTLGVLAVLSRDLPTAPGSAAGAQALAPKDTLRIDRQNGNAKRDGCWAGPQRIEVRVASGHVRLDFTEAAITQPVLRIDANVHSGTLTLLTAPGIEVDADEVAVRSGSVRVTPSGGRRCPWSCTSRCQAPSPAAISGHAHSAGTYGGGSDGAPAADVTILFLRKQMSKSFGLPAP